MATSKPDTTLPEPGSLADRLDLASGLGLLERDPDLQDRIAKAMLALENNPSDSAELEHVTALAVANTVSRLGINDPHTLWVADRWSAAFKDRPGATLDIGPALL